MSEWSSDSEELFRSARSDLSPTASDRARVRQRLAAKLAAGAVAATVTTTATNAAAATNVAAAKTVTLGLVAKIVAPVIVVGGVAAATVPTVIASRAEKDVAPAIVAPAPAKTSAARIAARAAEKETEEEKQKEAEPEVTSAPPVETARMPRAVPKNAAAAPPRADGADEVTLVAGIDAALRAGDVARANELIGEHERRFPRGLLVEEREGARVIARCMSGSRSAAESFLAAHPRSPMRARIEAACRTGR